jgi:hypothetical protein
VGVGPFHAVSLFPCSVTGGAGWATGGGNSVGVLYSKKKKESGGVTWTGSWGLGSLGSPIPGEAGPGRVFSARQQQRAVAPP